ncbi:hypothetical protein, partial [Xanthomonas perforans]|uniref:hypothetical protein n=2 Tax=Xanthomonas perforans TaxID=442694 RepID=UPI001F2FA568
PQSKRTEGFFFAQALGCAARKCALHSAPLADRYRCRAVRAVPLATQATRSSLGEKGAIHLLAK